MDWFEYIKQNNARIMAEFQEVQPRYYKKREQATSQTENKQEKPDKDIITGEPSLLLHLAYLECDAPLGTLQKKLGWGAEKFQKHCTVLINKSLAQIISVNFSGKKGGLAKYLVLTEKGLKIIKVENYIPKSRGGTSSVHTWLQKIVADFLKDQDYKIAYEVNNSDTTIDIVASYQDKKYALEIICSTEKTEPEKLQKIDKSRDYEKIIFICMNKSQSEKLRKQLQDISAKTAWVCVTISGMFQGGLLEEKENG